MEVVTYAAPYQGYFKDVLWRAEVSNTFLPRVLYCWKHRYVLGMPRFAARAAGPLLLTVAQELAMLSNDPIHKCHGYSCQKSRGMYGTFHCQSWATLWRRGPPKNPLNPKKSHAGVSRNSICIHRHFMKLFGRYFMKDSRGSYVGT